MTVTINGTTGIANDGGYTGDGVVFADTTPANTLVTDTSGNVGIGTSSPQLKLVASNSGVQEIALSPTGGVNSGTYIQSYNRNTSSYLHNTNFASSHTWYSGGTRAVDIDSSGNLLVGATAVASNERLYVNGNAGNANNLVRFTNTQTSGVIYGLYVNYSAYSPNAAGNDFFGGSDSTASRFRAYSNGGIANYSANNVNLSDRREKTNFAPAGEYLAKICAIPVQMFNYIDQNMEQDGGLTLGVVAQDVQAVAPELVTESNWGTPEEPKMRLSIYQTDLQYALMKCIQEQQAIIAALTARVTALEGTQP